MSVLLFSVVSPAIWEAVPSCSKTFSSVLPLVVQLKPLGRGGYQCSHKWLRFTQNESQRKVLVQVSGTKGEGVTYDPSTHLPLLTRIYKCSIRHWTPFTSFAFTFWPVAERLVARRERNFKSTFPQDLPSTSLCTHQVCEHLINP